MMKKKKFWKIICILAIIAYTLKNLFVGADTDEGYGIMVGYRLAMGVPVLLHVRRAYPGVTGYDLLHDL